MSAPTDRPSRDGWLALAAWAAVVGLFAWSAWQRWSVLTATPYPVGVDGYYYPLQLRSLLERGHLAYPSAPLAFWLMLPLAALTDPITGAKLGAALGGAAVVFPAFLVGRRLGGAGGGLAAAVVAATTGGSFFLSAEFVKHGLGLTVALTAVWLALRAAERPGRGRLAAAVVGVGAAVLTHKLAGALALTLGAVIAVARAWPALAERRVRRNLAIAAAAVVAAVVVLGVVAPARFPGGRELRLLGDAVDDRAAWSLPALIIDHGARRPPTELALGHQGLAAAALAGAFLIVAALGVRATRWRPDLPREARALAWAALGLCALVALPWLAVRDPDGIGFRLRVSAFAPAAVVAAALVGRITAGASASARTGALVVGALAALWLALRPARPTEGQVRAHPAMVAALRAARGALPADAVVVTVERHLGFQLAWYARVPVRMRPGPVAPARLWRLLPGNLIGFGSPLDRALTRAAATPGVTPPLALHPRHPAGLVLVPEATWTWILGALPARDAAWWRAWHTI